MFTNVYIYVFNSAVEDLPVWDIYYLLFIKYIYISVYVFIPGVEGLPVWDKPVGGRHV